jgi:anaerobic dimethyl sulfoxide reductase subunit A
MIVACEPDDTINPGIPREDGYLSEPLINQGLIQTRPCVKGYTQTRMLYDPRRLKYPLKRVGRRGEGRFTRISWDEALDTITRKLVETKKQHGPYSILHQPYTAYGGCWFPIAPWFGAGFAGWGTISFGGLWESEQWVLGKEGLKGELAQDEANIFKAGLILLWGFNPLTTLNGKFAYSLLRARENGIPIICIESRYSPSAEVLADQWIPIRPTTDVAMMIAMANVWFKENLCDYEFIKRNVEPEGLQKWRDYVLGIVDGTDKTPAWAEVICGVPAETIIAFARLYVRSKPVNLHVSGSIGRQFQGENPARAAMYLQALSGNAGVQGATCGVETFLGSLFSSLPTPAVDWQPKPGNYKPPILGCHFKWLKAINLREKLDRGELTPEEYNVNIGNPPKNPAPNIQMVILESTNEVASLPDINSNIKAMQKTGFNLVTSYFADTLSARYADILLPQIATAFEGRACQLGFSHQDLFFSSFNHFIYRQKCVDPPGEIKTNEWLWVQIARRLGIAELAFPRLADVLDDRWDGAIEDLHKEAYEKWTVRKEIAPMSPPDWAEFQQKPVFRWAIKEPRYPFKKGELNSNLSSPESKVPREVSEVKLETASGKIEFYSRKLARGPAYLSSTEFSPGCGNCYGGGNLPAMAQMTFGGKDTFHSQDTQKYPLLMSTPHSMYRVHSLLDNQPLLNSDCYRHAVWMNIIDAQLRGIVDDDNVRVFNDVGEVLMPAYVTSKVVPGTVCIFHGSWYIPGEAKTRLMPEGIDLRGSSNLLTHNEDLPDTIIGVLPCKGLVQIEKWKEK